MWYEDWMREKMQLVMSMTFFALFWVRATFALCYDVRVNDPIDWTPQPMAPIRFLISEWLPSNMSFQAYQSNSWYFSFQPVLSSFVCVFRLLPLFYPYLPIISLSSPHLLLPTLSFSLCIFSLSHVFLPPINPQYALSFTISFPVPQSSPLFTFLYQSLSPSPSTQCCSNVSPLSHHIPPSLLPSLVRTQRMAAAHSVLSGSRRFVHSHSGFASWNTEK